MEEQSDTFDLIYEVLEVWKQCKEYPYYEISDQGRVRVGRTGRILKPWINNCGYLCVHLRKDANGDEINKQCLVHRLVAIEFVPNPTPAIYTEINHKSEIKADNRACNLEWCDRNYNMRYGTLGERNACNGGSRLIIRMDKAGNIEKVYDSMRAVRLDGYNNKMVNACSQGKYKSHYGKTWRTIYNPPQNQT